MSGDAENNMNVQDGSVFTKKLEAVMDGLYDLMEYVKEENLERVSDRGVIRYFEEEGKTSFQVARQFDRPSEFLQVLLDIIRVNFEPSPLGTLFLNSNMSFIYEGVPKQPFKLCYASLVSEPGQTFERFWEHAVMRKLAECGYALGDIDKLFVVASTGTERYNLDLMGDVTEVVDTALYGGSDTEGSQESEIGLEASFQSKLEAGYCHDPVLGDRVRLSLWGVMT